MKEMFSARPPHARRARIALIATLLLFALSAARPALAQTPTWTANNAYQAYTGYTSPDPTTPAYFFLGPNTYSWSDPTGNGTQYSIIVDKKGDTAWHTFWQEAEKIELAEDAYYWAGLNSANHQNMLTRSISSAKVLSTR